MVYNQTYRKGKYTIHHFASINEFQSMILALVVVEYHGLKKSHEDANGYT